MKNNFKFMSSVASHLNLIKNVTCNVQLYTPVDSGILCELFPELIPELYRSWTEIVVAP